MDGAVATWACVYIVSISYIEYISVGLSIINIIIAISYTGTIGRL